MVAPEIISYSAYATLILGWAVWLTPFLRMKRSAVPADRVDSRARFGVALQSLAYWLLFFNPFWKRTVGPARWALAAIAAAAGCWLAFASLAALGKHWRIDAGLNPDHELVRSGPYQLVRHPIYLSMFCMLMATGSVVAPLPFLLASSAIFIIGTEIRVRIEDALLASRFREEFAQYRQRIKGYVPLLR